MVMVQDGLLPGWLVEPTQISDWWNECDGDDLDFSLLDPDGDDDPDGTDALLSSPVAVRAAGLPPSSGRLAGRPAKFAGSAC